MAKDEALKIAIECGFKRVIEPPCDYYKATEEQLEAFAKALAEQPTQEPIYTNGDRTMTMKDRNFTSEGNGYIQDNNFDFDAGLRIDGDFVDAERDQYAQMICNALNTQQPTQEPMTHVIGIDNDGKEVVVKLQSPLYTHPKQWQGLSDVEIAKLTLYSSEYTSDDGFETISLDEKHFVKAIETKLREKNT